MDILRLIEERADENWPENIIEYVINTATNSPHPEQDFSVFAEKTTPTPHSLLTNAINSVRGSAMETLSQLLWNHSKLAERFKPVVINAVNDKNEAVRYFSFTSIYPYYNIDAEFSINMLKELVQKEICVLGHHGIWEIICRDYYNNSDFYLTHLLKACKSNIEDLDEKAASYLCAIAIYYDFDIAKRLYEIPLNDRQLSAVCEQAAFSFGQEEFRKNSKEILLHYINEGKTDIPDLNMLFYEHQIDISRDEEFILRLLCSNLNAYQLHNILEYINKQDSDTSQYTNILHALCEKIPTDGYSYDKVQITNDLIKCLIQLLSQNNHNDKIKKQCLDMWDIIYKSSYVAVQPFSQMLDNLI